MALALAGGAWWQRLLTWFRRPGQPQRLRQARPAQLPASAPGGLQSSFDEFLDRFPQHPGAGLTVEKIIRAYRAAEAGYPREQCDIFDDRIEADAHLRSMLEQRVEAVARKAWVLQEGGDTDADKDAARMLEEQLRLIPNFIETLEHQLKFNWYGYAATEIDWQRRDGLSVPVWFENVSPHRFNFDSSDRPLLTTSKNWDGSPLAAGKWWVTTRSGRIAATSGLMRTACFWSHFKTIAIRDWLVYLDRFGIPFVTGTYEENAADEDKDTLEEAVQMLGSDGYAIFSEKCKVEIKELTPGNRGSDNHESLIELCDNQISKLVGGATLLNQSGSSGSYALSRVHENRGHDLIKGDAEKLAQSFESQIGIPFLRYNGIQARPPRLKMYLSLDLSLRELIEIASICANELGMPLDEDQIRQMTLLRKPTGAELVGTKNKKEESIDA